MKLFIFFFFSINILFAQETKPITTVPLLVDSFVGVDAYKNLYSITNKVLSKNGPDGAFVFNDLQLGKITSVDIVNPLRIVLFFQETNTVVFLDNRLNEIERLNFNLLPEFINVSSATNASNNRLWIFNTDNQQLELFNFRTNQKQEVSQPFPGKLISQASNFNYCFTLTDKKLRSFNIYGSLLKEMDILEFEKIVQQEENVIALKENKLYIINDFVSNENTSTIEPFQLELPEIKIKDLQLTQDFLYLYDGKNLLKFSIQPPK